MTAVPKLLGDLKRNNAKQAFAFWLRELKRTGTVSRETNEVLSMLQDDPKELNRLLDEYVAEN